MLKSICLGLSLILTATFGFAGEFKLENGSFSYHQASQNLKSDMQNIAKRSRNTTYFAYKMERIGNYQTIIEGDCRWNLVQGHYGPGNRTGFKYSDVQTNVRSTFTLIFSYRKGSVERIALVNDECTVDGGGETIHWLHQVSPIASIQLLTQSILEDSSLHEEAMVSIAMHKDPLAVETLIDFSQTNHSHDIRKTSIFWLGQVGKEPGLNRLIELVGEEESLDLRKHLTFVLSIHKLSKAQDVLKDIAVNDASEEVRTQAFFWMAQSGHPEAEALILEQLENDPSNHFLSQAGFMLSQLPDGRGTAHLERFATESSSHELRKQSLFWLGQSKTESALEKVLHAIDYDKDIEVQKHAVFVLGQFEDDMGLDPLLDLAQNHSHREIRGTAMFWLGQKANKKARNTLRDSVMNDGDEDVMEQALMGIAQMQNDAKVPLLIKVAQEHKHAKIREKAVFWLSQSNDPNALDYIKTLLLESP